MARVFLPALLFCALVGCRVFSPDHVNTTDETAPPQASAISSVQHAPVRAAGARPEEPATPVASDESISRALECLERDDAAGAIGHLRTHLRQNPDQVLFRAQLGDLLVQSGRLLEAQQEYERVVADSQDRPSTRGRLIHYHTRLMEIARAREDEYGEFLHRGIGLHLVACQLAARGEPGEVERIECKAMAALKEAQLRQPDDARAAWYLHQVWRQLDQPRPAEKALRKAVAAAPFSTLTPCESRELTLAARTGSTLK